VSKKQTGDALIRALQIKPGKRAHLRDKDAGQTFGWEKEEAETLLDEYRAKLEELQYKLYADGRFAVLVVLQGIDAGGKDGTCRHVISAFNPQGCTVTSFKAPSSDELKHDYLWRIHKEVPPRGSVGVFNRSHYEDVLVVRVDKLAPKEVWSRRYDQINRFERMLTENNVHVVKCFLQISAEEQKKRFEERLNDPSKQWKFSTEDLAKRKQWDDYRSAFEDALTKCSTECAPWHVIPANKKWFRNLAVAQLLVTELSRLPLRYPEAKFDPAKVRIR
jgi:PPK2 family polyphosphate:nucleotide phosphotransferase